MTTSVADRFKLLQKDLETLAADWHRPGFEAITALAYEMPLVGAMETQNSGTSSNCWRRPGHSNRARPSRQVWCAGAAPSGRPSTATRTVLPTRCSSSFTERLVSDADGETFCFVTSNYDDFSVEKGRIGDGRTPTSPTCSTGRVQVLLRDSGLQAALADSTAQTSSGRSSRVRLPGEPQDARRDPRGGEEFFDRVWYERSVVHRPPLPGWRLRPHPSPYKVSKDAQARVLAGDPIFGSARTTSSGACGTASFDARWVLGQRVGLPRHLKYPRGYRVDHAPVVTLEVSSALARDVLGAPYVVPHCSGFTRRASSTGHDRCGCLGCCGSNLRIDVGVRIRGQGNAGVAQGLLDGLHAGTAGEEQACRPMTEIVQPDRRQTGVHRQDPEAVGNVVRVQRRSIRAGEHLSESPTTASREPVRLLLAVCA